MAAALDRLCHRENARNVPFPCHLSGQSIKRDLKIHASQQCIRTPRASNKEISLACRLKIEALRIFAPFSFPRKSRSTRESIPANRRQLKRPFGRSWKKDETKWMCTSAN